MTCIGFQVVSPGRAIAWADAETYAEGRPSGCATKLFVNPLARMVLVGTGRVGITRDAADEFSHLLTFEEGLQKLPGVLRRAVRSFNDLEIAAQAPLPQGSIAVVGFSERYGLIGAVFSSSSDDFEPRGPLRSWLSPKLSDDSSCDGVDAVIATVLQQLVELRHDLPSATGGALVVAEITPSGIHCGPIFDLSAGRQLRGGWRPPAEDR